MRRGVRGIRGGGGEDGGVPVVAAFGSSVVGGCHVWLCFADVRLVIRLHSGSDDK